MMVQKPLSAIEESDLMTLVKQGVEEQETLDYKLEMCGSSDSEKKEMLREILQECAKPGGSSGGHQTCRPNPHSTV